MKKTYIEKNAHTTREAFEKLRDASLPEQRFKFFGGDTHSYEDISRMESDTHVYWAVTVHIPKWNQKTGLYLKHDSSAGCTYDKTTKKFKWWFGKHVMYTNAELHQDMCKYFNADWFLKETDSLKLSTSNSVFVKVLLGKITNTDELIKGIIKVNPTLRNHNLDTTKVHAYLSMAPHMRVQGLADYADVAEDINVVLDRLTTPNGGFSWMITGLITSARMLNKKIDFTWNDAAIKAKHDEWNKDIENIRKEWLPLYSF